MASERVVVIGAGIGGLACAIDLAAAGLSVGVVERAAGPGGKMCELEVAGARIDTGPTVMTLRRVFDDLFEHAGAKLADYVTLHPMDLLARHAWRDGATLDLFADEDASEAAIGAFAGKDNAAGYRRFRQISQGIFETLDQSFLHQALTGPVGLSARIGLAHLHRLRAIRPFTTLWDALGEFFPDPRLRQLFGRYATYCGSSPFQAPATLMLIAHVEQAGVWTVAGGMQRLADGLERLARSLGVTFHYGCAADRVLTRRGRACGVRLADGNALSAEAVVMNADADALPRSPQGKAAPPPGPASLSALTWAMTAEPSGLALSRHNVFFSDDYAEEFKDLFGKGNIPRQPTVYICAQDRDGEASPRHGPERLFLLINAPALKGLAPDAAAPMTDQELRQCETQLSHHLHLCGLDLKITPHQARVTTPLDFAQRFPLTGGALYGRATHGWAAAFQRRSARTPTPCLYQAGGGAHPGAGVPMAALSGRLAARQLISDLNSTRRFHPAAIGGGMSTV